MTFFLFFYLAKEQNNRIINIAWFENVIADTKLFIITSHKFIYWFDAATVVDVVTLCNFCIKFNKQTELSSYSFLKPIFDRKNPTIETTQNPFLNHCNMAWPKSAYFVSCKQQWALNSNKNSIRLRHKFSKIKILGDDEHLCVRSFI